MHQSKASIFDRSVFFVVVVLALFSYWWCEIFEAKIKLHWQFSYKQKRSWACPNQTTVVVFGLDYSIKSTTKETHVLKWGLHQQMATMKGQAPRVNWPHWVNGMANINASLTIIVHVEFLYNRGHSLGPKFMGHRCSLINFQWIKTMLNIIF